MTTGKRTTQDTQTNQRTQNDTLKNKNNNNRENFKDITKLKTLN